MIKKSLYIESIFKNNGSLLKNNRNLSWVLLLYHTSVKCFWGNTFFDNLVSFQEIKAKWIKLYANCNCGSRTTYLSYPKWSLIKIISYIGNRIATPKLNALIPSWSPFKKTLEKRYSYCHPKPAEIVSLFNKLRIPFTFLKRLF